MTANAMLGYLYNGPLKLALVAVLAWLGLFTLFISSGVFLHGHDFQHPLNIIPNGAVESRTFSVAVLKSFPLSSENQQILHLLEPSSYIPITFDNTSPRTGPIINRLGVYGYQQNRTLTVPISSRTATPWDTFGLRPADAVELNDLVYTTPGMRWTQDLPRLVVYAWQRPAQRTSERRVIRLSLMDKYTPGDEFASITQTMTSGSPDSWSITFAPNSHPSASSRALPVQRTLALFLWPVIFHVFLGPVGMAGVVMFWVCLMTAGYACVTVMVAQWAVRSGGEGGEERRGQGAALRWEEEGWADINAVGEELDVRRTEGRDNALLLKDQV